MKKISRVHFWATVGAVALGSSPVFATSVMDTVASDIATAVAGAITAGLVVFASIATVRYIIRAFRASSKG